jgi:CRISPR/Cas system CMR-associated protein Cmr5 small subunit
MKNLEQIRAQHALQTAQLNLQFGGRNDGGAVAKKIPPHILNHGLLQTLAFAQSENGGYKNICDRLADHLSNQGIVQNCRDTESLLQQLVDGDSTLLKLATSEALAWFNYARRFIQ